LSADRQPGSAAAALRKTGDLSKADYLRACVARQNTSGAGGGRIVRIGDLLIKLSAGIFYNVVQPINGSRWVLNADLTLIF
jgi:hypothetical protein